MTIAYDDGSVHEDGFQEALSSVAPEMVNEPTKQDTSVPFERAAERTRSSVLGGRSEGAATKVITEYPAHAIESMATLPKRAFEASEKLATTGEYDPGPALETAFKMAGTRFPFIKAGEAGLFGGRMTQQAVKSAEFLENQGMPEATIKSMTGLERGAEGMWRREFSDAKAELNLEAKPSVDKTFTSEGKEHTIKGSVLSNIFKHDELFAAYPEAADLPVLTMKEVPGLPNARGSFSTVKQTGQQMIILKEGLSEAETKSTLLHEVQHWIQHKEGFATGNIKAIEEPVMGQLVSKINKEYGSSLLTTPQYQIYRRLANEVEARNVQARADLGPEHIKGILAKETEDIPRSAQLVMSKDRKVVNQGTEFSDVSTHEAVKDLLDKGYTYQKIANELDLNRNQVAGIANKQGLKSKNPQGFQSEDNPAKLPRYGKKGSAATRSVHDKDY